MPDVISNAAVDVRLWVALDVHKLSIVAAILPPQGGQPEVQQIETTRAAIRRFIDRLGGPEGLAVCYEAGPGGFDLLRVLSELGVACDVIAPSLIPVRVGDRIKTDRRDAEKLVRLYRGGQLSFVQPPSPETEGLRDLMRCRDDLRCARTAARHRVSKQLLRHGRIYPDGKSQWTKMHRAWIARQRRPDRGPDPDPRAWQAQIRLHARYRHLTTERGKRSTIATVAVTRELACFLWAAVTDQPFVTEQPVVLEAAAA
ncbi:MAG: IS110 family transposase [Solirubrobacteraceae bacterium]